MVPGEAREEKEYQVYETSRFAGRIPIRTSRKRTITVPIRTDGLYHTTSIPREQRSDARVIRGDGEIDTNDWTHIELRSQRLSFSENRRTIYFDIVWRAYEGNRDKSYGDTIIQSMKTIQIEIPYRVKKILPPLYVGSRKVWYRGKIHRLVSFPNYGMLSSIFVRFDKKGSHDDRAQELRADLTFSYWTEE